MESLRKMVEASARLPAPPPKLEKVAPKPIDPPSIGEQKAIIERIREYALNYSKSLPNFICTEVTRRYYDDTGQESWVNYDTLTTRLYYIKGVGAGSSGLSPAQETALAAGIAAMLIVLLLIINLSARAIGRYIQRRVTAA